MWSSGVSYFGGGMNGFTCGDLRFRCAGVFGLTLNFGGVFGSADVAGSWQFPYLGLVYGQFDFRTRLKMVGF